MNKKELIVDMLADKGGECIALEAELEALRARVGELETLLGKVRFANEAKLLSPKHTVWEQINKALHDK